MNRLWKWLEKNSSQLQGLAAVAAILAGLAAVPFLLSKWLQPELVIKVMADSPTMPPALEAWIREAMQILRTLPQAREGDPYRGLRSLQESGPLDPVRAGISWRLEQPSRLRVDVINQTDRVIPGVRLRLDRAYPAWGVTLVATFLTPEEVAGWQKGLSVKNEGPAVVLPELPPLPPRSAVSIVSYGDVADAEVSATVPGAVFKLVPTVRVEDKWPLSVFLRPYWVPFTLFLAALAAIAILAGLGKFERVTWQRARRHVLYNFACSEAKAGRKESALALLQEAIAAGYNDFQHMRSDADLEGLREIDTFKKLVGS